MKPQPSFVSQHLRWLRAAVPVGDESSKGRFVKGPWLQNFCADLVQRMLEGIGYCNPCTIIYLCTTWTNPSGIYCGATQNIYIITQLVACQKLQRLVNWLLQPFSPQCQVSTVSLDENLLCWRIQVAQRIENTAHADQKGRVLHLLCTGMGRVQPPGLSVPAFCADGCWFEANISDLNIIWKAITSMQRIDSDGKVQRKRGRGTNGAHA